MQDDLFEKFAESHVLQLRKTLQDLHHVLLHAYAKLNTLNFGLSRRSGHYRPRFLNYVPRSHGNTLRVTGSIVSLRDSLGGLWPGTGCQFHEPAPRSNARATPRPSSRRLCRSGLRRWIKITSPINKGNAESCSL